MHTVDDTCDALLIWLRHKIRLNLLPVQPAEQPQGDENDPAVHYLLAEIRDIYEIVMLEQQAHTEMIRDCDKPVRPPKRPQLKHEL